MVPSTKHSRKRCFASRLISLVVFISLSLWHRQLTGRFFCQTPLVVCRQDLAGNRRGRAHHQTAYFLLQLGEHPSMILRCSLSRPGHDLFSISDRLLRFLLAQAGGGPASIFHELTCCAVGLRQNLLALGLSFC